MTRCLFMCPMPESGMLERMVDVIHICVAMKPLEGNFAQNALEQGVAGLNVDGCRIATGEEDAKAMERCNTPRSGRMFDSESPIGTFIRSSSSGALDTNKGRWPANIILDEEAGALLDEQSGKIFGKAGKTYMSYTGDKGGASRFFKVIGDEE